LIYVYGDAPQWLMNIINELGYSMVKIDDCASQQRVLTIDREKNLIKGGGAALTREKVIDYWAGSFIVIVDEAKLVDRIPSKHPIPIEVIPFAWSVVKRTLETEFGGRAVLRSGNGKRGPVVTDNGNYILDYTPNSPINPTEMEVRIKEIPGVVEVGIFSGRHVSKVIIGRLDSSIVTI